jgi:hypothetical protein
MLYSSKKDLWIVLLITFAGIMLIGTAINLLFTKGFQHSATLIMLLTSAFYLFIIFICACPVYYKIEPPLLLIKSGVFTYRISLSSIDEVTPTRNPLSAPAWSLDRLHISYRKKGKTTFALISPLHKDKFLRELVENSPGLEHRGSRIVRI